MKNEARTNFFDSIPPFGEDLETERLKALEKEYEGLSEKNKKIYKEILEAGDIRNFREAFREKDYRDMLRLYEGEILKDNFLYKTAVMSCLRCKESAEIFNSVMEMLEDEEGDSDSCGQ